GVGDRPWHCGAGGVQAGRGCLGGISTVGGAGARRRLLRLPCGRTLAGARRCGAARDVRGEVAMIDHAWNMLFHDKLRIFITLSGVAFSVTLVLVQTGLFGGLLENATITIEHMGADVWVTSRNSPNLDFVHQFSESNVERVRAVSGVKRADNLILSFMQVSLPSGAEETTVVYALEDFSVWGVP